MSPALTTPPIGENCPKNETNNHAKSNPVQNKQHNRFTREPNKMSIFLSILALAVVGILISIAVAHWQKGNVWDALWWGLAAYIVLGVGAVFTYHYSVIKPAYEAAHAATLPTPTPVDRAWLSVDVVIDGPLVFRDRGVDLSVKYIIKNSGHSPANGVIVKAEIISPATEIFDAPVKRQKEICEKISYDPGITIFHDTPETLGTHFVLSRQEMEAQFAAYKKGPESVGADISKVVPSATPYLIGCVDYQINDSSRHQTGFIYYIQTYDPAIDRDGPVAIPIGKDIPANQLVLRKWPFGGDFAN